MALLLASVAAPLAAATDLSKIDLAAERAAIERFQDRDQMLQNVGWQLARSNVEFCTNAIPSIGLQLQDLASYGKPEIARAALKLNGSFAVQTAARGSPADRSGAFTRNREVIAVGGYDPNSWEADKKRDWQRLARTHDFIDAALAQNGKVEFAFADGAPISAAPNAVMACATRFELAGSGKKAVADGSRVVIGAEFPGFAFEEEIFAGVVAHELAHNLLGHTAWLDRNKRTRRHVRLTEREADRLMPWLLANAGYDPRAAQIFFERYKPGSGSVLFIAGSHDKWRKRAELAAGEVPRILALMDSEGKADWSLHFRREIDPALGK